MKKAQLKARSLCLLAGLLAAWALASAAFAEIKVVALPSKSPLVTLRAVFLTGAAADPAGQPGLACLTAAALAQGGTRELTYKQIVEAMYPMATSVSSQVDKEMTTFSGATHADNLEKYYALFRSMILDPGWRADDFRRLKDDQINFLRVSLRGNNDEELGKEVLYNAIYEGHPYGHHNAGTVSSLEKLAVTDLQRFYKTHYTQNNLILGIAGGYPAEFVERMKKDFSVLPAGAASHPPVPAPKPAAAPSMLLVDKDTRSVAYSLGFPIDVKRGDPDYPALLVMQSYFGQHRDSGGRLFQRMREQRGLNYGDYTYIEYFPQGMFRFEPAPNLARSQQIFQVWIRPVEPPTAHFALRLALYELDRLIKQGMSRQEFERTRSFVSKYVNVLTRTKSAELGYAIDSQFYGIPDYNGYVKKSLAKLTAEDVNRAIKKHLRMTDLRIVAITKDAGQLREKILAGAPSPMTYNSPKPKEIMDEDKTVEAWKINLKPENVQVVAVGTVFE
jgi:zinc protease